MPKVPNIRRLHIFAISQKNGGDKVYFLPVDKHKIFLVDSITLGVRSQIILAACGQGAQITQNNNFTISLQYLKKEVSGVVDFLYADKHKSFLQFDMIFDGNRRAFPNRLKQHVCYECLYNISKKKLEMKLIFCMQINIKVSYKLISRRQV